MVGRYGRAIAYFKMLKIDDALSETNSLIEEYPNDPYFYEIKGQILLESQKVEESIKPYMKANELLNDSALIKTAGFSLH